MGRLYYEKKHDSTQPKAFAGEGQGFSDYLDKVARLIPSEIIAGYLTMIGFVGSVKNIQTQNVIAWIVFAIGLILTPIYLNNVAQADKPKRNHLILSTVAFLVWAYVTTGKQLLETISPNIFDQAIASIALVAFSLISAVIPLNK
jgi:phosphoglycerol transferase MdoB-like AlkP superfamily enzyme